MWIWAVCGIVALAIVPIAALMPRRRSTIADAVPVSSPQPAAGH
jgi:hypothetical protein